MGVAWKEWGQKSVVPLPPSVGTVSPGSTLTWLSRGRKCGDRPFVPAPRAAPTPRSCRGSEVCTGWRLWPMATYLWFTVPVSHKQGCAIVHCATCLCMMWLVGGGGGWVAVPWTLLIVNTVLCENIIGKHTATWSHGDLCHIWNHRRRNGRGTRVGTVPPWMRAFNVDPMGVAWKSEAESQWCPPPGAKTSQTICPVCINICPFIFLFAVPAFH